MKWKKLSPQQRYTIIIQYISSFCTLMTEPHHRPKVSGKSSFLIQLQSQFREREEFHAISNIELGSMKMDLEKEPSNQIYTKVLKFIDEFINRKIIYQDIKKFIERQSGSSLKNEKSTTLKMAEPHISFKKMPDGVNPGNNGLTANQQNHLNEIKLGARRYSKKISIAVEQEQLSNEQFNSENFISKGTVKTIRQIKISHIELNQLTISQIFDMPCPFLINLSLCLFVKYYFNTSKQVAYEECSWVLCIATIVACKLYYEQSLEGIMDYYMSILKINKKDLLDLERCFCQELNYCLNIRNEDYHFMLYKFITTCEKEDTK